MAGPIDVQTIMNKTPVTEKIQDVMEKNAENRHVHVAHEMNKENEHNQQRVTNVQESENPIIQERNRKKRERERREVRKKLKLNEEEKPSVMKTGHFVDLEA
jgi:hypothetical protein